MCKSLLGIKVENYFAKKMNFFESIEIWKLKHKDFKKLQLYNQIENLATLHNTSTNFCVVGEVHDTEGPRILLQKSMKTANA